jgi:NAD+ diphosphatase
VPVWRSRNLVVAGDKPRAIFLDAGAIAELGGPDPLTVFLGVSGMESYFALDVSHHEEHLLPELFGRDAAFVDLRGIGALLARDDGALLAYARGMLHWHARHRHCSLCGAPARPEAAGHVRRCADAACNAEHFPRTDPAVIMLVTHEDHALLGRQRVWPAGMHSTLAGFVEPGESLEEAVAREVMEEAGVRVVDVRYHSSQPWPFPASIMLGFHARALRRDLAVDAEELETAGWFSRDFLSRAHDPEVFRLPRPDSIARRLIEDWLRGEA